MEETCTDDNDAVPSCVDAENAYDSVIPASLEAALVLNYAYQELLNGILNCVDVGIGHASYQREELTRIVEEACTKQPCRKKTLYNLVYPYFRDESDMPAPKNEDCELRTLQKFLPKEYSRPWKDTEKADLRKAVYDDGLRNLMAPLLSRLELEYAKLDKVDVLLPLSRKADLGELVAQKETLKASIASIQEELNEIRKTFTVDMVNEESMVDWLRISMSQFEGYHTSESCAAAWRNVVHPAVRDGKWTASEDKRLKELVAKYKERQWAQIAVELGTGRSPFMCLQRYQSVLNNARNEHWTSEEDERLIEAVHSERTRKGIIPWMLVAAKVGRRSASKCITRWNDRKLDYAGGPWRTEEDVLLAEAANMYGLADGLQWLSSLPASRKPQGALWIRISGHVMTRTPIQCKHRWTHSLDPRLKFGQWTRHEDAFIARWLHEHGHNGWTELAARLPGRTANMVIQRARRLKRSHADVLKLQSESPAAEEDSAAASQALPEDVFSSNTKIVRSAMYQRRPELIAGLMMVQMSNRLARDTPHMDKQQLKSVLLNNLQRQMGYVPAQLNAVMKTKVLDAAFQPTFGSNSDLKTKAAACMSELGVAVRSKGSIVSAHSGRRRRPVQPQVAVDGSDEGDQCEDLGSNEQELAAHRRSSRRRQASPQAASHAKPRHSAGAAAAGVRAAAASVSTSEVAASDAQESQPSAVITANTAAAAATAAHNTLTRSRAAAVAAAAAIAAAGTSSRAAQAASNVNAIASASPARTADGLASSAVQSGPGCSVRTSESARNVLHHAEADAPCSEPRLSRTSNPDGLRCLAPKRPAAASAAAATTVDIDAAAMSAVAMKAAISVAKMKSNCSVPPSAASRADTIAAKAAISVAKRHGKCNVSSAAAATSSAAAAAAVAVKEGATISKKRSSVSSVPPTDEAMAKKGRLDLTSEEAQVEARIAEQILAISKAGTATSVRSLTTEHEGSGTSAAAAKLCLQMMGLSQATALARLQDLSAYQEKLKQYPPAQAHRMLASAECIQQLLLSQAAGSCTGHADRPSPQPAASVTRPAKTVREQLAQLRSGNCARQVALSATEAPCAVVVLPMPASGHPNGAPVVSMNANSLPVNCMIGLLQPTNTPVTTVNFNGSAESQPTGPCSSARDDGDSMARASPVQALPTMPPQASTVAGYRTLLNRMPQLEACCDSAGRRKQEEMEKKVAVARRTQPYDTLQARLESLFLWPAVLSRVTPTDDTVPPPGLP